MAAAHSAVHHNRQKRQHKEGPDNELSQLADDRRRRRSSAGSDLMNVYTANDLWEEGKGETFGQVLNHSQPIMVCSFWPHLCLEFCNIELRWVLECWAVCWGDCCISTAPELIPLGVLILLPCQITRQDKAEKFITKQQNGLPTFTWECRWAINAGDAPSFVLRLRHRYTGKTVLQVPYVAWVCRASALIDVMNATWIADMSQ